MIDRQDRHYTEAGWTSIFAAWGVCLSLFLFAALTATAVGNDLAGPLAHAQLAADATALDR